VAKLFHIKPAVDRTNNEWTENPFDVDVIYNPNINSLTIPAAVLQPPIYFSNTIPSLIYGALGSVIGHAISHT
jgi:predicted metalloendopeptidase